MFDYESVLWNRPKMLRKKYVYFLGYGKEKGIMILN